MLDVITNYFPPEEAKKGALIPIVFSAAIVGALFVYIGQLYKNEANLSNLSFWGSLFSLNYLVILVVIVAFWV